MYAEALTLVDQAYGFHTLDIMCTCLIALVGTRMPLYLEDFQL